MLYILNKMIHVKVHGKLEGAIYEVLLLICHYNTGIKEYITFFLEYQRAYLRIGGVGESVDIEKDPAGRGPKGRALAGPQGWSLGGTAGDC